MKFCTIVVFCFCLLGAMPVKLVSAASTAQSGVHGIIQLPETARCGDTVTLMVSLPKGPGGSFPHVGVDWLTRPEGKAPDVLPGVPETDIVFHVPGQYRCRIRIGHMIKGA